MEKQSCSITQRPPFVASSVHPILLHIWQGILGLQLDLIIPEVVPSPSIVKERTNPDIVNQIRFPFLSLSLPLSFYLLAPIYLDPRQTFFLLPFYSAYPIRTDKMLSKFNFYRMCFHFAQFFKWMKGINFSTLLIFLLNSRNNFLNDALPFLRGKYCSVKVGPQKTNGRKRFFCLFCTSTFFQPKFTCIWQAWSWRKMVQNVSYQTWDIL